MAKILLGDPSYILPLLALLDMFYLQQQETPRQCHPESAQECVQQFDCIAVHVSITAFADLELLAF